MSRDEILKDSWYKLIKQSAKHQHARMQLEEIKDANIILSKGICECKPKNYKDILGIIRYVALSKRLLDVVTDTSICAKFLGIIIKSQAVLDVEGHLDALNAILNIYAHPNGKNQIFMNDSVIDYVRKSLTREYVEIAKAAADIYIRFLKDSNIVYYIRC